MVTKRIRAANKNTSDGSPSTLVKVRGRGVSNLYRRGRAFYVCATINGRQHNKSLRTSSLSEAKIKRDIFLTEKRQQLKILNPEFEGRLLGKDAAEIVLQHIESDSDLKIRTKEFYAERHRHLLKSWPEISNLDVGKISKGDVKNWAARFKLRNLGGYSSFNGCRIILGKIFEVAVDNGIGVDNPVTSIKAMKQPESNFTLPKREQWAIFWRKWRSLLEKGNSNQKKAAEMIRIIALTGVRVGEARGLKWGDINFESGSIYIQRQLTDKGAIQSPKRGSRKIPVNETLTVFLEELISQRSDISPDDFILRTKTAEGTLKSLCAQSGMPPLTHHNLRDYFATICVENGVPVVPVAEWLGHADGGKTLLKSYLFYREEVHQEEMGKVKFNI